METNTCIKCGIEKPVTLFREGRNVCIKCRNTYAQKRYIKRLPKKPPICRENIDPRCKPLKFVITKIGCFKLISHGLNKYGYPNITRNKKTSYAHRFIYQECFGEIPNRMVVRHKCDNPACINPEHLELGTQYDNIQDRVKRGRNGSHLIQGSLNKISKLNEKLVEKILLSDAPNIELAIKYGVTPGAICHIKKRRSWKHVAI